MGGSGEQLGVMMDILAVVAAAAVMGGVLLAAPAVRAAAAAGPVLEPVGTGARTREAAEGLPMAMFRRLGDRAVQVS